MDNIIVMLEFVIDYADSVLSRSDALDTVCFSLAQASRYR